MEPYVYVCVNALHCAHSLVWVRYAVYVRQTHYAHIVYLCGQELMVRWTVQCCWFCVPCASCTSGLHLCGSGTLCWFCALIVCIRVFSAIMSCSYPWPHTLFLSLSFVVFLNVTYVSLLSLCFITQQSTFLKSIGKKPNISRKAVFKVRENRSL